MHKQTSFAHHALLIFGVGEVCRFERMDDFEAMRPRLRDGASLTSVGKTSSIPRVRPRDRKILSLQVSCNRSLLEEIDVCVPSAKTINN